MHGDRNELTTSIMELRDVGIRWKDGKGTTFSGFRRVRALASYSITISALPRIPSSNQELECDSIRLISRTFRVDRHTGFSNQDSFPRS